MGMTIFGKIEKWDITESLIHSWVHGTKNQESKISLLCTFPNRMGRLFHGQGFPCSFIEIDYWAQTPLRGLKPDQKLKDITNSSALGGVVLRTLMYPSAFLLLFTISLLFRDICSRTSLEHEFRKQKGFVSHLPCKTSITILP